MLNVGLIGYGYWGPNLARYISELEGVRLAICCDLREERLRTVTMKYPGVEVTTRPADVLHHPKVDAVMIATPVSTHYERACEALAHVTLLYACRLFPVVDRARGAAGRIGSVRPRGVRSGAGRCALRPSMPEIREVGE